MQYGSCNLFDHHSWSHIAAPESKKTLSAAIAAGSIVAILLYRISMVNAVRLLDKSLLNTDALELLVTLYGINLLQEVMNVHENGKKNANTLEQFNNPRASIMIAPFFIGM
ncbi:MAG: hypothetical protein PHN80_16230, partial [Hespellia sp.]|nr:hypothetical protein [Hespellia sp.]